MVVIDNVSKGGVNNKRGFKSFFGKLIGSKRSNVKTQTKRPEVSNRVVTKNSPQHGRPSSMTVKLSTPTTPQTDGRPQLLTDILMNQELFDVFHGKSLILQAEVTVEKPLDGSSKSIIVSGQVPVTLSKGFRNGKPTREIRVRGHLRRRRSNEQGDARAPEIFSSFDQFGSNSALNWETEDKYGLAEGNNQQNGWKSSQKNLALRSVEQPEFQTSSPFHTYSNMGDFRMDKKNNITPRNSRESGYLDQKYSSDYSQENPTGIANWSPYFEYGSSMSGQTAQGNPRTFHASWDLKEKSPSPKFPSTKTQNRRHFPPKDDQQNTMQKSQPTRSYKVGDWTPRINVSSSSTSKPDLTKTRSFTNKTDVDEKRHDGVHFTLDKTSTQSTPIEIEEIEDSALKELSFHDNATQTNGASDHETEIGKISHKVGDKLSHLKEVGKNQMGEKLGHLKEFGEISHQAEEKLNHLKEIGHISHQVGEKLSHLKEVSKNQVEGKLVHLKEVGKTQVEEKLSHLKEGKNTLSKLLPSQLKKAHHLTRNEREIDDSNTHGKRQVHDRHGEDEEPLKEQDRYNTAERTPIRLFREMKSKLVQAKDSSIDQFSHITGKNVHVTMSSPEKCICDKGNESTGELHRAAAGSEDSSKDFHQVTPFYPSPEKTHISRSHGDYATQTRDHNYAETQDEPLEKPNKKMVSKSVQTERNSSDKNQRRLWDIGDYTHEKLNDLEKKVQTLIRRLNNPPDSEQNAQHDPKNKIVFHSSQQDLNSRSQDEVEDTNTTHPSSNNKNVNPIATITISRSRTRFFNYDGHQYSRKAGPQVVTIEAPKGLFYSDNQPR